MNIGTSLKTISKNQLCSFIGTGGYVELAETDVLSDGSIVTAAAVLPLLNSRNDKGDGILPPGYQKVEFLASSGTQYIELPDRFNFGQDPETNSGILLKTSDYETKATNYAFTVPVTTSAGSMPKSEFYIGRRSANESIFRVGLNGVYGLGEQYIDGKVYEASINFLNSGDMVVGEKSQNILYNPAAYGAPFRILRSGTVCRLYEVHTSSREELTHSLIPALDLAGEPCMFDTVTKQPFYNDGTGSFRVGIATLQQVRELQLPDNTGNAVRTLYVSLPQEARTDFTAQKHLSYLTDSLNWSLNVQYRDGDIPADYTKVDFLESTGTQNIVVQSPELRYSRLTWNQEVDIQFLSDVKSLVGFKGRTGLYWGRFEDKRVGVGTGAMSPAPVTGREKLIFTTRCFTSESTNPEAPYGEWRSTLAAADGSWDTWRNNLPGADIGQDPLFGLFRYGDDEGNLDYNPGSIRIWSCKCWCDSVSYDLVPVLDKNGVPGMWDKVGKKFLDNSGTGAFIVGIKTLNDVRMLNNVLPDVTAESPDSITLSLPVEASTDAPAQKALKDLADRGWSITVQYREDEIPAGYAKVAFLESSGTQYIDTEVVTDGTYTIQGRMSTIQRSCSYWGRRTTDGGNVSETFPDGNSILTSDNATRVCINYIKRVANRNAIDIKQVHTYEMKEGQLLLSIDGLVQPLNHLNAWSIKAINNNQLSYYLFWENKLPGVSGLGKAVAAVYSFRMQDGEDKTVLDLIPVINTDGVPGMYDKVSKKFFENAGTGQFRVGLASKEAVRNLYLTPDVQEGITIDLSVPAGTTEEDTNTLKANNPNYTFNIQYRS